MRMSIWICQGFSQKQFGKHICIDCFNIFQSMIILLYKHSYLNGYVDKILVKNTLPDYPIEGKNPISDCLAYPK